MGALKVPPVSSVNNNLQQQQPVLVNVINNNISKLIANNNKLNNNNKFVNPPSSLSSGSARSSRLPSFDESDEEQDFSIEWLDEENVRFGFQLEDGIASTWTVKMLYMDNQQVMLIDVDKQMCQSGSKAGFVRLLECAEDDMGCAQVYVSIRRTHADMKAIMRTFMYLGFTVATPAVSAELELDARTTTLLVYHIE